MYTVYTHLCMFFTEFVNINTWKRIKSHVHTCIKNTYEGWMSNELSDMQ